MLQRVRLKQFKYLVGVSSVNTNAATTVQQMNDLAGTRRSTRIEVSPERPSTTLRLGGARVLNPTRNSISNANILSPFHFVGQSIRDAGLSDSLLLELMRIGITKLTPLQGALIPLLLGGRHVVAHAETGSGKSFGVALATCNRLARDAGQHRLNTIIFVPTDTLALQYETWIKHFAGATRQVCHAVTTTQTGLPIETQLARIHNVPPHVLVGTPAAIGQVMEHSRSLFNGESLRSQVDTIIIDEVDLVLTLPTAWRSGQRGMTGADLITALFRCHSHEVPAQLVALSATIDGDTAHKLNDWMKNDDVERISTSVVEHHIPAAIQFYFMSYDPTGLRFHSPERGLAMTLKLIFTESPVARVLIFTDSDAAVIQETVGIVKRVDVPLAFPAEVSVDEIHEDIDMAQRKRGRLCCEVLVKTDDDIKMRQNTRATFGKNADSHVRENAPTESLRAHQIGAFSGEVFRIDPTDPLSKLQTGAANVAVAPYGLARGLHIRGISHVILYCRQEAPSVTGFVHAAGRTGRMGKSGKVIVLFSPSMGRALQKNCDVLRIPWRVNKLAEVETLLRSYDAKQGTEDDGSSKSEKEKIADEGNRLSLTALHRSDAADMPTQIHRLRYSDAMEKEEESGMYNQL